MSDESWRRATRWPQRRGQVIHDFPFAYEIVGIIRELEAARPDYNQPVTEEMVDSLEELWQAFESMRQEWLPYMKPTLRLASRIEADE